jgi:2-keto-3-deoxy-galactonokinase
MPGPRTNAAFYAAPVAAFLTASEEEVYAPLVGLNVATRHGERSDAAHAVFLSGNGPLVAVLREALARDDLDRARRQAHRVSLNNARLHPVVC